jgi:hypothetical protein
VVKKRRKRKSRYKRGIYISSIAGECKYRSGWELSFCEFLDSSPEVLSWSYEKILIEYVSNKSSGKTRNYFPDFFVEYKNGEKYIYEIKPKRRLANRDVIKKAAAATSWSSHHGMTYKMLTEDDLRQLGIKI